MKKQALFKLFQAFLAFVMLLNVVACSTAPTTSSSSTTPVTQSDSSQTATATIAPAEQPEPWDDAESFMNEIDMDQLAMAVFLPYGGGSPNAEECNIFWEHQLERHINGNAISQHTEQEIMDFLGAVAGGKAELVKVALRAGNGLAALFRFAGRQWLFFIGEAGLPSAYRPVHIDQWIRMQ